MMSEKPPRSRDPRRRSRHRVQEGGRSIYCEKRKEANWLWTNHRQVNVVGEGSTRKKTRKRIPTV